MTLRPLAGSQPAVVAFNEGQQTHTRTIDALGVDREFPPSDTQEFSLPLKKAGEFKVYCPVPPRQGDDGGAEGE